MSCLTDYWNERKHHGEKQRAVSGLQKERIVAAYESKIEKYKDVTLAILIRPSKQVHPHDMSTGVGEMPHKYIAPYCYG